MKKTILTIVALLSTIGVAKPLNYDYTNAFNKLTNIDHSRYNEIDLKVTNNKQTGVGLLNGDGTGLNTKELILKDKYLIPKTTDGHDLVLFNHTNPDYTNTANLDSMDHLSGNGALTEIVMNLDTTNSTNNNPIFIYAYDKVTKEIHKIYKKDGSRAVIRQINSEDIDSKLTKEVVDNGTFKLGNGYIEANDLYKLMIGEIKDNDPEKTDNKMVSDRSRYGVSGKTVFDYLEAEKTAANMETPANKFVTDTKVKAYIDGLNLGGGNGVAAANEFEYDKSGAVPTIEFKTDKGTDKILKGIAKAVNPNEAVNKAQLDEAKQEIEEKINGMGGGVSKATAGVSTAIAIANLPLEFTKERPNSFAFGIGYYGKHAGFALGYGRKLIDNSLTLKLSSSINTAADVAAGAGVGYSW